MCRSDGCKKCIDRSQPMPLPHVWDDRERFTKSLLEREVVGPVLLSGGALSTPLTQAQRDSLADKGRELLRWAAARGVTGRTRVVLRYDGPRHRMQQVLSVYALD